MDQDKRPGKPAPTFPNRDLTPEELRPARRWVGFKFKWNGHKWNKPPHSPIDGSAIGATAEHSAHFLDFDGAVAGSIKNRLDGVGFVFVEADGFVGIDFDECVANGEIHTDVVAWLRWFPDAYVETSPSGRGLHAIFRGSVPKALTPTPLPEAPEIKVEAYGRDRYFTFTGNRVGEPTPLGDCQAGLDKLLAHAGQARERKKKKDRPMAAAKAREIHAANLEALRKAPQGAGNAALNQAAFFAARALKGLGQTEERVKAELLEIVTREWRSPHPEDGARKTIESGWRSGLAEPLETREGPDPSHIPTNPGRVLECAKRAEQVLAGVGLKYFERGGELVNTAYGRDVPTGFKEVERDADSVVIREAPHETIVRDLDTRAVFAALKDGDDGPEESRVHVPRWLPGQVHDRVRSEPRDVPFPSLDMVAGAPVLLPSGSVSSGLFEEGVLFVPRDRNLFPKAAERPSRDEARSALGRFWAVFGGFPFVDPGSGAEPGETSSYAVVLAGILSLVARPFFGAGAVPLFAASAHAPRSGKTKLVEASCFAALGHRPTAAHYSGEEELGKHLQPLMRAGDRAVLIDNVETPLRSAKLCVLITGGVLRDRVLGESRDVVLRNRAVLFATGNNIVIGGDLAARSLRADIDPGVERPESRAFGFDPVARARESHPLLAAAALAALRAFVVAGQPWTPTRAPWGGFEKWDGLVSGCLTWLGFADPFLARDRIIEADPIRSENANILAEWHQRYGQREVSLREIRRDEGEVFQLLLKDGRWDGYHAQWRLRKLEGRICDGYRLERRPGRGRFIVTGPKRPQGDSFF